MKKTLLTLAGMALLFTACSKKDDTTQPEDNYLKGLLKGEYSITDTARYEYNSDKTVSRVRYGWIDGADVGGGISTYKYANNKMTEVWLSAYSESLVFGPNTLVAQYIYAGDKLQKIVRPQATGLPRIDSIGYGANGKAEKVFYYEADPADKTKQKNIQIDVLEWTGNNITKITANWAAPDGSPLTAIDTYTFDDKPNYQGDILMTLLEDGFDPEAFNANNVTKVTRDQGALTNRTNTFELEYNSENKVIKQKATYTFKQSGTEVNTFEYYK
ncbi:hypothetical protein [Chitinophaga flava]|uniref:DUF4595 domain-containing protein n=1 Tax=Chitinophaga flava TaxID=2259036 RepID=A0A365XSB2_9BACT|nr:hypothetical protein [Chitinophaga flava]RBL89008.1 hypothetical protein DF182_20930 [Chitinophaga flava]